MVFKKKKEQPKKQEEPPQVNQNEQLRSVFLNSPYDAEYFANNVNSGVEAELHNKLFFMWRELSIIRETMQKLLSAVENEHINPETTSEKIY